SAAGPARHRLGRVAARPPRVEPEVVPAPGGEREGLVTLLRSRADRDPATMPWRPAAPGHDVLAPVEADTDAEFRPWRPSRRLRALLLANLGLASFYLTWWLAPGHVGTPILYIFLAAAEAFNFVH